MGICVADTETTSLHPDEGEVYEVGLITPDGAEHHWWLPVTLEHADEMAIKIGRFHERHPRGNGHGPGKERTTSLDAFARSFARITHGHHLVGAVVSFDAERLARLLRRQGVAPSWHYHLIDVEALAAGYIYGRSTPGEPEDEEMCRTLRAPAALPWDSHALSRAVGVEPDDFDRHTALGDARWAKAMYEAVMG